MNKRSISGFAAVELLIVVVVLAAIAGVGYFVWNKLNAQSTPASTSTTAYTSPPVTVPTAPQVNSASDLNSAMTALNQTTVSSSNVDSSQLTTDTSGF